MPITTSEALGILERAFRTRNPTEIESVLRDNLNLRVAVINSIEEAEQRINMGYQPITVSVPYFVFKSNVKNKKVYEIKENFLFEDKDYVIGEVNPNLLLPNKVYFLLKNEAGYHPELGLTFYGEGEITGFVKINKGELAEKFGVGRYQTWEEHTIGAYNKACHILEIYRSFIMDWTKSVFKPQKLSEDEIKETSKAIILAIKIAVFFHDIGKLREEWQETVGWEIGKPYIARTEVKQRVPFHAPYVYPFLRILLKEIIGDYNEIIRPIALAAARHHSLEVTGKVEPDRFQLPDNKAIDFLDNLVLKTLPELKELKDLKDILIKCVGEVNKGSLMDEPPSPSDDFYFIYTLTNRIVKFADWEDAGGEILELPNSRGEKGVT